MPDPQPAASRRETRLLLATIAVSVGVLLLLARFRFPEEAAGRAAEPAPAPLERLAARATYDELAGIMADLERRIGPSISVLGVQSPSGETYVPAVRLAADRAVAVLPSESQLAAVGTDPPPAILNRYDLRELVVVQVGFRADFVATPVPGSSRPGPRYVALVEASARQPTVRPVYVGHTELFTDPRWSEPILTVGAVQQSLPQGAAMFSLDSGFIGLVVESGGTATVIPANTLLPLVNATPSFTFQRGDLDIEVQPLTPALARASGAKSGVMVSYVPPSLAASGVATGDVIQSVDGVPVTTVAGFQQVTQSRTPGAQVVLAVIRREQKLKVALTATPAGAAPTGASADIGATLRSVPGVGVEIVTVERTGVAQRAGLRRGDLIVALDGEPAPEPAEIVRAFRAAVSGDALLLTIRRDGGHRVIPVEKP